MAWQDISLPMIRVIINDLGDDPSYNDSRLQQLLVVSALYIDQELSFSTSYTISMTACSISPEPDDTFINLMVLKAACILARGTQRVDANQGYVIQDGPSKIDGRQVAVEQKNIAKDYCADYESAAEQHRLGSAAGGRAVIGVGNVAIPFRSRVSSPRSRFS